MMAGEMGAFVAGSIVGKLLLDKTGWNASVREVTEKDKRSLGSTIDSIGYKMTLMGKAMTVAGGIIVAGFGAILKSTARAGEEIFELSQKLGISTELLSGYKLAAENSGISLESFARSMGLLAKNMVSFDMEAQDTNDALRVLGISTTDNSGKLKGLDIVMLEVAERFHQMEDGAMKAALAKKIFGRAGIELIPMLNLGSEGLKKQREEAERLGIVFSKDAAKSCDDFNDRLKELKEGIGGVSKELAMQLMPMATELIIRAKEVVIQIREWVAEHPALVKWITESGLKLGILLTGAGMFLIMIPKLVTGIRLLTASYGGLGAALMIAYGAYKLLEKIRPGERISEEVAAYNKLTKAIGYWSDFEDAAVRASIAKREELHAVWDKYGQDTLEAFKAIAEGKEGEALKKFLDELSGGHAKALAAAKDQKSGLEDLKKTFQVLIPDISKAAGETFGFTGALKTNTAELALAGNNLLAYLGGLKDAPGYLDRVTVSATGMAGALAKASGQVEGLTPIAAKTTASISNYFDGLYNDIATGWGNTVQKWMEGGSTLKDFVEGLWDDIKNSFFRMIGEMVADWVLGQFKKLFSTIADTATKTITDVGTALSGAASGWATGIGAAIGSFIGTFLANLVAGGPSGHAQEQMINDMKDSRNFLAEIRNWFVGAGTGYGGASYEFITGHIGDWLGWINESVRSLEKTSCGYLKTIAEGIAGLPSAQAGAYVSRPALVHVHAGEYIIPRNYTPALNKLPATINKAVKPTVIENHIYIDGREIKLFITKTVRESGGLGLLGSVGKAMA